MWVVNFLGTFAATPAILKHHNTYCSYADTIMPHFFFAVGFAYRLTYLRRAPASALGAVRARFWQRNLRLILFGAVFYLTGDFLGYWFRPHSSGVAEFFARFCRTDLFQTLVHIGVTALWCLPVIGASRGARLAFAAGSAALHLGLSHWFYFDWVTRAHGIDGGPLGFLTWTIPVIVGSLAHDCLAGAAEPRTVVRHLLGWGCAVMALGYALSCLNLLPSPDSPSTGGFGDWMIEPPFVPPTRPANLWTMSQQAGTVSYLTFGAGLSLTLYALFVWVCEVRQWQIGMWRTLGSNALAGYVIHVVLDMAFFPLKSRHAPLWLALGELVVFTGICYGCVRLLEKRNIYWRM